MKLAPLILLIMTITNVPVGCRDPQAHMQLQWGKLSPVPDSIGFAGSFVSILGDRLLVAGGANFPDGGFPWTGSAKRWTDRVFLLDQPGGKWSEAGKLPIPLGYGGTVQWHDQVIFVGGSNETGHSSAVFSVRLEGERLVYDSLPDLPHPIANTSAVLIGDRLYMYGGIKKPDSPEASAEAWVLDLNKTADGWKPLPALPGKARMFQVLGTDSTSLYVFSGTTLVEGQREYLTDAYRYTEATGWRRLADLPSSVTAAPGPAICKHGRFYIFGGDDGLLAPKASGLKEKHPGFSDRILCYDIAKDSWSEAGKIHISRNGDAVSNPDGSDWAPVTTGLVEWRDRIVVPGGEVRPATRTNHVLTVTIEH